MFVSGVKIRLQPATIAVVDRSVYSPWQARSTATMLLEHAVSTVTLDPRRSKNQLNRLERMEEAVPVT